MNNNRHTVEKKEMQMGDFGREVEWDTGMERGRSGPSNDCKNKD